MHHHTINCSHPVGMPVTGTGDNPLRPLRVEPVIADPQTIEDYANTVDFRVLAMHRWIEAGEKKLALETIARIEGDLQQIRLMLKGQKKLADVTTPVCYNCGIPKSHVGPGMFICQSCPPKAEAAS